MALVHGNGTAIRYWSPLGLIAVVIVATIAVYWRSFEPMTQMWTLRTYQYGWYVYPITFVMLWHNRDRITGAGISPSWAGLAGLASVIAVWTVSTAIGVQVLEFLSATLVIPMLVWAVGGKGLLRAALFPLFFLVAGVPVGESIVPALMRSTADIAAWLLDIVGVPAFREGMFMTLPGGQFEVADVCSGLRFLLTGTVLSTLFAYWNYQSIWKRLVFIVSVGVSLIVANGLRAFIVMYVASATDMRVFAGRDHVIFGTVLFVMLAILLMYIGSYYADQPEPSDRLSTYDAPDRSRQPLVAALTVLVFLFGPVGQNLKDESATSIATLPFESVLLSTCLQMAYWLPDWQPELLGPDAESRRSWECGDVDVSLYQAAYGQQEQGKELVSASNELWPHEWRRRARESRSAVVFPTGTESVREVFIQNEGRSILMWYWYDVNGLRMSSPFGVKFIESLNALRLSNTNSAIVMLIAEGRADVRKLREHLQNVVDNF